MTDKTADIDCYQIIPHTARILNLPTLPVTDVNEGPQLIIKRMFKTMYKERGIGLAANQVGLQLSIIVVDVDWVKPSRTYNPMVLINPKLVYSIGRSLAFEGCLSVPRAQWLHVPRYSNIGVDYFDIDFKPKHIDAENMLARCLQHEIDHLNGKTILDYVDKTITVSCCETCRAYKTTLFNVVGKDGKKTKACTEHRKDYTAWVK